MAIKAVQVVAAPVSSADQKRFMDDLQKHAPFLNKGKQSSGSWNSNDLSFSKGDLDKVIEAIEGLGWVEGPHKPGMHKTDRVWLKGGKWPLIVSMGGDAIYLRAPSSDSALNIYEDTDFADFLSKMARKLMPSGFDAKLGQANFTKRGMGAPAQSNLEDKIVSKAKSLGFKSKDYDSRNNADGSMMGHGTTLVHADGWELNITSGFGESKYTNYFSVTLKYTKERENASVVTAATGDITTLMKLAGEAEEALTKVDAALRAMNNITVKMPAAFRADIHNGNIQGNEMPQEYGIWVSIENLKGTYELSKAMGATRKSIDGLRSKLKSYKK